MANLKHYAAKFRVEINEPFNIKLAGRQRWALEKLIKAGEKGCTAYADPAPRWAAYIHDLRSMGIPIETLHEKHGGEFSGTHARYRLTATVQQVQGGGE